MRRRNNSQASEPAPEVAERKPAAASHQGSSHWAPQWGEHEEERVASWLRSRLQPSPEEAAEESVAEAPPEAEADPWALPPFEAAAPVEESAGLIAAMEAELAEVERQEQLRSRDSLAAEVADLQQRRSALAADLAEEEAAAERARRERLDDRTRLEAEVEVLVARREQLAVSAEAAAAAAELARQEELDARARLAAEPAPAGPRLEPAFDAGDADLATAVAALRAERALLAASLETEHAEADQARRQLLSTRARLAAERDQLAELEARHREVAVALVAERCDAERTRAELEAGLAALAADRRRVEEEAEVEAAEARRLVDEQLAQGQELEDQLAQLVERRRRLVQETEAAAEAVARLRAEHTEAQAALTALDEERSRVEASHFAVWVELDREVNELEQRRRALLDDHDGA